MSIIQPVGAIQTLATGELRDVVLSPDGATAYVSNSEGWVTALDVATGDLLGRWKVGVQLGGMDVSSDGRYLVVTEGKVEAAAGDQWSYTGTISVHLLDTTTGSIKDFTTPVSGYDRGFYDAAFTDDGKVIFTQTFAGSGWEPLTTLDLTTGVFTTSGSYAQDGVLSSANGGGLILLGPQNISDAPLFIYSSSVDNITVSRGGYRDNISGFNGGYQSISNDGRLVAQSLYGSLYIFDGGLNLIADLGVLHPELGGGISGVDFSADGHSLFVMDTTGDRILELSTADWSIKRAISLSVDIEQSAFWSGAYGDRLTASADGSHLIVFAADSIIAINLLSVVPDGGTDGADTLNGSSGADEMDGLGGADLFLGLGGADTLLGGSGDDTLIGGDGDDRLDGGSGDSDWASYSSAGVGVSVNLGLGGVQDTLGAGRDQLLNIENLEGSAFGDTLAGDNRANLLKGGDGADSLAGGGGSDTLLGGSGDDLLSGDGGDDVLEGGDGRDVASYASASASVVVDLSVIVAQNTRGGGFDTLAHIEGLQGSIYGDDLKGDAGANTLSGGAGVDTLAGGGGDDLLIGGAGADTLAGGAGHDVFRGTLADLAGDRISDFSADDVINITGVDPANFTYARNGATLTLSGGVTLSLAAAPTGDLVAASDGQGGVNLTLVDSETVRNDFNGDGRSDLAWREAGGMFSTWLMAAGNGPLAVTPNQFVTGGLDNSWALGAAADFNGDGKSDLLWRNADGAFSLWNSTGTGFAADAVVDGSVSADWSLAATGDFNGDGKADLIFRHEGGTFTEWQSTGTGFNKNVYVNGGVDPTWSLAGVGDFNGDGRDDLVWRHDGGTFSLWASTGDGFAANTVVDGSVSADWALAAIADFNGDGKDDLIWRHEGGIFTEWRSNGAGFDQNVYVDGRVTPDWSLESTGDFNGDGKADLLWRHDTGMFTVWQSTGDSFALNALVDTSVGPNWALASADYALV